MREEGGSMPAMFDPRYESFSMTNQKKDIWNNHKMDKV